MVVVEAMCCNEFEPMDSRIMARMEQKYKEKLKNRMKFLETWYSEVLTLGGVQRNFCLD